MSNDIHYEESTKNLNTNSNLNPNSINEYKQYLSFLNMNKIQLELILNDTKLSFDQKNNIKSLITISEKVKAACKDTLNFLNDKKYASSKDKNDL